MDNKEDILRALEDFEEKSTPNDPVPELLENYLRKVANTGETLFEWDKLKALFLHKMNLTMLDFSASFPSDDLVPNPNIDNIKFDEMKNRILETVSQFAGVPFTIQRLCELLTNPHLHYKRTDKFLRGLEKNLNVVSSVDPFGNKIVSHPKSLYNGMEPNGMETGEVRTPEKVNSPFLPPPPPTNSPVGSLFTAVTGSGSPSPLLRSWPRGEGSNTFSKSTTEIPTTSESNLDQTKGDEAFSEYMPPMKKARVDPSELSLLPKKGSESDPVPSVSDTFSSGSEKNSDTPQMETSPTVSTDCSFGAATGDQEQVLTPSPMETMPCQSESSLSTSNTSSSEVTMSEPTSSSSTLSGKTQEQPNSTSDLGLSDNEPGCITDTDKLPTDQNSEQTTSDDSGEFSVSSNSNDQEESKCDAEPLSDVAAEADQDTQPDEMETDEPEPREQIEPQPLEDGSDKRDSQGFDVSPNPEGSSSPPSEPDTSPNIEACHSPIPEPEVSSSSESVASPDSASPCTNIPLPDSAEAKTMTPVVDESSTSSEPVSGDNDDTSQETDSSLLPSSSTQDSSSIPVADTPSDIITSMDHSEEVSASDNQSQADHTDDRSCDPTTKVSSDTETSESTTAISSADANPSSSTDTDPVTE